MLTLAVDTSTRSGSAAVLRDAEVIAEVSGIEETPYSTRLFRDVAELQSRAGFRLADVHLFAVAAGPGSFTGLRVGLTAVKAWAEVYRKPIAAVSGLEAIASQWMATADAQSDCCAAIVPFLDARRGQIFGAICRAACRENLIPALEGEEAVLSPEDFADLILRASESQAPILVSPTPEVLPGPVRANLPSGTRIAQVSHALAPAIGRVGFWRAQQGELTDALHLAANYVRRSDAETTWKDA
jgi:tRNA threonylcarbamoyladenosine biosynthesis protein TsaB